MSFQTTSLIKKDIMKSFVTLKFSILTLLFILFSALSTQAAYHKNTTTPVEIQKSWKKQFKQRKQTIKQKFQTLFTKSNNEKNISILALVSIILGALSVIGLVVGFIILLIGSTSGLFLLFTGLVALLGDIFSIATLIKIRKSKDPKEHSRSKHLAIIGLILSLLTGLLPLGLFLLLQLGLR